MASWLDWLYQNQPTDEYGTQPVQPQTPGPYAPQSVPTPPQRPQVSVPLPPQRPTGMNGSGMSVPLPPQRPAGLVAQAGLPYGDKSVVLPSELPGVPTNGAPQDPYAARNVPLPPRRPDFGASPKIATGKGGMPVVPPQAERPAPAARPVAAQAPQRPAQAEAQHPALPPAPEGQRWVLAPIEPTQQPTQQPAQAPAGAPGGGSTSTPTMFGSNMPEKGFLNGLFGQGGQPAPQAAQNPAQAPTGLAAMLGAQPSAQAANSTGPTAFLDQLFGFRR